jgi:3'-phosphoadenosine 5'-phosphosulfate sulfotransferase (PAPS reductase)/FAD synthetase
MAPEYIGMFSGGKDSLVACHKFSKERGLKEVVYCDTGVGLNLEYVKNTCKKFNWKLNIVKPLPKETYEVFVERFGFPHQGMHSTVMGFLKWHPIRKWNREQKKAGRKIIFVSGRRKNESKRRLRMKSNKELITTDGMTFYSYIYNLSTPDVWSYIHENNLERSPTYETMHLSGDCLCGAYSSKGESDWLTVFHPEMAERFRKLEQKYGGKWGNQISLTDMKSQTKLDDLICSECVINDEGLN